MPRIAIVGGGPGGLLTAYLLTRDPAHRPDITIFDAAPEVGGKLRTLRFDGDDACYEAGVSELYAYPRSDGGNDLWALATTLGLSLRSMRGGAFVENGAILRDGVDLVRGLGGPAARAVEQYRRLAVAAFESHGARSPLLRREPAPHYRFDELLRTVDDPRARRFLETAVHSDLATEPHLASAGTGLRKALMDVPGYVECAAVAGGMTRLRDALLAHLTHIEKSCSSRVTGIDPTASALRLHFTLAGRELQRDFDAVVLALPIAAMELLQWQTHRLREVMTAYLARHHHLGSYLRVSMLFDEPFWRSRLPGDWFMVDAFGGACVYDESARLPAGGRGVLGWLLAGSAALSLASGDDVQIRDAALDALPAAMRPEARRRLREVKIHRWCGALSSQPGCHEPKREHQPDPQRQSNLFVVGDHLFDNTLNGVLRSAQLVTGLLARSLGAGALQGSPRRCGIGVVGRETALQCADRIA